MEKLRDLKDKLMGGDQYHPNLLGESLPNLLRKATAKTLVTPDESVNQLVVDTIQQEVSAGKDTKEIVSLLKKRLRTDNPQKQWLGIQLFGKVMTDCGNELGIHQEELLQEVARVMARPARPETEAGKAARMAAKELLRRFGRAGTTAFRAAHQEVYGRPMAGGHAAMGQPVAGYPTGAIPYGYTPADYGGPGGQGDAGMSVERQSLAEEINLLIDKARSNTELLSDMLVNTGAAGSDEAEFEQELISDLLNEVVELRGLFNAYLEQLQSQEGADMEVLMVQALEATDMLDGCIALHKDINSGQELPTHQRATSPGGGYTGSTLSYQMGGPAAGPGAPPPASTQNQVGDLIALDDLADAMTSPSQPSPAAASASAGGAAPVYDPFAASTAAPLYGHQANTNAPGAAAGPQMKSAFESMFAQPGAAAPSYGAALAASAAPPQPGQQQQPSPQQQQQQQQQQQAAYPGAYGAPQYGGQAAPQPAFTTTGAPQYGAYAATPGYGAPQYGAPPAGQPAYGSPGMGQYGGAAASPNPYGAASSPNPYGAPPPQYPPHQQQQQQYGGPFGQQQSQQPQQQPSGNNPFAALPHRASDGAGGFGMPMPPPGLMGPAMPHQQQQAGTVLSGNNPFATSAPRPPVGQAPTGVQPSVDQEWDMFFADRAAGGPGAMGGPGPAQHVNADFDALVAKPTAAR